MAMHRTSDGTGDDESGMAPLSDINVTPMVDVMLVLLVIFMVTAPLMMSGIPLQLPKTAASRIDKPREPVILSLDKDGRVFVGTEQVPQGALAARLRAMAASAPDQVV